MDMLGQHEKAAESYTEGEPAQLAYRELPSRARARVLTVSLGKFKEAKCSLIQRAGALALRAYTFRHQARNGRLQNWTRRRIIASRYPKDAIDDSTRQLRSCR